MEKKIMMLGFCRMLSRLTGSRREYWMMPIDRKGPGLLERWH
jgi:hypothetical protein